MFDPVTVASTAALTEGVKFLYGQVTDVLKARREGANVDDEREPEAAYVPLPASAGAPLNGELRATLVDPQDLDEATPVLRDLRAQLAEYQDGLLPIEDAALPQLLGNVRGLLERLYQQRLTFDAELGSRSGTGSALAPADARTPLSSIVAAARGAVAAKSISGQVATGGSVAIGGSVHSMVSPAERASDPRPREQ